MAKQDDKHSMAKDYLRQVESEGQHPWDDRGTPSVRYEPKWKYKRVYKASRQTSAGKRLLAIIWWIFVIANIGYLTFQIFAGHHGRGIFISILFLIVQAFPYFMNRETRK
jgi:hypothetical protein